MYINAEKIAIESNLDVVIAASTHLLDILAAQKIKKQTNAKLIFEVRDLWPLTLIELGNMSKWHPFIMLMRKAEKYAYEKADSIVTVLPKAESYMVYRGMHPSKFHYIPNGIEISEWEKEISLPDELFYYLDTVKKLKKPIIGYAGAYGLANDLDLLIDVAKLCPQDFEVVLVGHGPERDRLATRVQQEKIKNVKLLHAIPKSCIPAFLKSIDITYISFLPKPIYRFGISPNKISLWII
ncbi:MAG TPA: glycosyltransferase family 4 protein [Fusibacter sp.]|nr:glycosyltransferase family 4 protein [Fusibacter sp.]